MRVEIADDQWHQGHDQGLQLGVAQVAGGDEQELCRPAVQRMGVYEVGVFRDDRPLLAVGMLDDVDVLGAVAGGRSRV